MSFDEYLSLFEQCGNQPFIGEASPSYLWESGTARRIKAMCPHANIIVILRDPVERAYSHYLMDRQMGSQTESSFLRAIEQDLAEDNPAWWQTHLYVALGMYYEQVRRYVDLFEEKVLILFFEELRIAPQLIFERIARFLDISEEGFSQVDGTVAHNAYSSPRPLHALGQALLAQERFTPWRILPKNSREILKKKFFLRTDEKPPLMDGQAVRLLRNAFDPDIERLEGLLQRELPELRCILET